ncbi:MAG TPA: leucine-rich repeat domain-containing protein, partial [Chitinophagales bacterium]|nr:leucine-rich repeat domain-containing protein [Chitinophagales bacterium]
SGLTNLTTLDLSSNQFADISVLSGLTNLTELYLHSNQLMDVSTIVDIIPELKVLTLFDNPIISLQPILPVLQDGKLLHYVSYNDFVRKRYIEQLEGIFWGNNPLKTPPMEVALLGEEAILRYFEEKLCYKYEGKLLIVGEPMSGKTTLLQKLLNPKHPVPNNDDESTIGIQVKTWQFKDASCQNKVRINVWDFGGQEIQYLTHQFFLSANAVYALLVSPRKDSDNVDYWFNIIALLGKDDDGKHSQVLAVLNEILNKETGKSTIEHFEEKRYRSDYPELPLSVRTLNFSKDDQRFEALVCELKSLLMQLPQMGAQLPIKWNRVRKALADLQRNYISLAEYLQLCAKKKTDETLANILLAYLHQIGE